MSSKGSPHHHDHRAGDSHEARQTRESWEQQKLRELGLADVGADASTFCLHCRREMLERLARAQARGSVLFDMVRREGLSPLPPRGVEAGDEALIDGAPELLQGPEAGLRRGRRAVALVLVAAALGALMLWAALAHLRP
ncbi:hypothetical protein [Sorangium sp. So ce1024]|uniref:hypothetical protein n=1 Tax=unclassified Sorangium TaxID=2621164 RepID=UPI003EFD0FCF